MELGALIRVFAVVILPHDLCVCLPNTMPKPQRKNRDDALACIAFLFAVGPVGLKQNHTPSPISSRADFVESLNSCGKFVMSRKQPK